MLTASAPLLRRSVLLGAVAAAVLSILVFAGPQGAAAQETSRSVDRILASVDGDPIFASEVDRAIGLGLDQRNAGEDDRALRRRVLDGLIEQRLRMHEVDRFGFDEVPDAEVERALDGVRREVGSDDAALRRRLAEVDFDEASLKRLLRNQLLVLAYVEERVGPRVFVALDDIRAYYEATLVPEMRRQGQEAPPLDEVRERIRQVLREQRLTEEIGRWTEELKAQAQIEDNFERAEREAGGLPPLRLEVRRKASS
jgi:peptidyl-prolyl cis-trans isomerase SurA